MSSRLLYLVGQLGSGGYERQLYYLLQAMDRERFRLAVAVWNTARGDTYDSLIRELGIPVYSFSSNWSKFTKLKALRNLVRVLAPEVVHSYGFYTNFAAHWATIGTRTVAIGSVRSNFFWDKKAAGSLLGRLSARWPRNQICNSFSAARTARTSRGIFVPKQLFVVRNGVDLKVFRSTPLAVNGKARILGLGSLTLIKRWDRLVLAALELHLKGYDFLLQIAGDGPLRGRIEQQIQQIRLKNTVELVGNTNDVASLLADVTLLVHTSDSEGCPNAVMEAMACGRAVVATDTGDVSFLIEDGKTGFVVRCGDDAKLVERMATLITNRDLCRRMGEAGRAKAEGEFGIDRLVAETIDAYRAVGLKD